MGCSSEERKNLPDGILNKDDMVLIISDLQLLEAAQKSLYVDVKTQESMRDTSYTIVFNKYNTTSAQFDSSMRTYSRNPKLLADIMESVAQSINTIK